MSIWTPTYKVRRATRILSLAVRQNQEALNQFGEAVFLLKRLARADTTFQFDSRRIPTITKTVSSYDTDPDTGYLRCLLWESGTDSDLEYPDQKVITATITSSGGTSPWVQAVDKYSFLSGRDEYAFDIFQDQIDSSGNPITDSVYIVFNTPPMTLGNISTFVYGTINPLVNFAGDQPIRDNGADFQKSLWGFEQWLKPTARIRRQLTPHQFPMIFPNVQADFVITQGGLIQQSKLSYWTNPPPYCPEIVEYDVIVRKSTGARYMVNGTNPAYIEDILVCQTMDLAEIDPRSSLYNITVVDS
jgi:hypothetical protein